jgi:putative transposase
MGWEKLLAFVSGRVDEELRLKVEYLVAENRILRGHIEGRVWLSDEQRIALAFIGKRLGRAALEQIASIVTPNTILAWHRRLVAAKFDTSAKRKARPPGRPPSDDAIVQQIVRMARENPAWGYRRIAGALAAIQISVCHQTVKNVLEANGIDPAPQRKGKTSWADFIKSHTNSLLATDFLATKV